MKLAKNEQGLVHVVQLALIVLVTGVVGFAGFRVYTANQTKQLNHSTEGKQQEEVNTLPDDLGNVLPIEEVKKLAANERSDSEVINIELKYEDSVAIFEVTLADGTVLIFDAVSGAVRLAEVSDTEDEDGDVLPADFIFGISFSKAREIALQKHQGKIRKIQVEVESGVVVFSVRFLDDARVDVNAANGDIVRYKPADSDTEEDRSGSSSDSGDESADADKDDDDDDDDDDNSGSNSGSGSSN